MWYEKMGSKFPLAVRASMCQPHVPNDWCAMWARRQVCIACGRESRYALTEHCYPLVRHVGVFLNALLPSLPTWRVMSLCLPFSWVAAKRSLGFSLSGFEVKFWLLTPLMAWVRAAAGKKTFSRQQVKKRLNCKKTFSKIKSIRCLCY